MFSIKKMNDENDFEYKKMKELEVLLKKGFVLPIPKSYKELPTDSNNWWDHFTEFKKV